VSGGRCHVELAYTDTNPEDAEGTIPVNTMIVAWGACTCGWRGKERYGAYPDAAPAAWVDVDKHRDEAGCT
jgi:hypothetical protein